MRFKVDQNLPAALAELLRRAGHEADTVNDEQLAGASDLTVSATCRRENRTLITLDRDFSDIRQYPPAEHPGILVLRPTTQDKETVLRLMARTIPMVEREPLTGRLWIVEEGRLRIRE